MKQKNKILFLRTAKTASSFIAHWGSINGLRITNNQTFVNHKHNQTMIDNSNFIFTSVRNPYRRAYSCYKYFMKGKWKNDFKVKTFRDF